MALLNLGAALTTIVLRGLYDRLFPAVPVAVATSSIPIVTPVCVFLSGAGGMTWLYKKFFAKRKIRVHQGTGSGPSNRAIQKRSYRNRRCTKCCCKASDNLSSGGSFWSEKFRRSRARSLEIECNRSNQKTSLETQTEDSSSSHSQKHNELSAISTVSSNGDGLIDNGDCTWDKKPQADRLKRGQKKTKRTITKRTRS